MGKPAAQTKCRHTFEDNNRTKTYRVAGFYDIASYFRVMPSGPSVAQSRSGARRHKEEEMGVDDTHTPADPGWTPYNTHVPAIEGNTHTPVDPGWTPYDCWVLHAEGDTHALVDLTYQGQVISGMQARA